MYLVAIGWLYVVLMMSVAEAANPSGTLLGAITTFVLYGLLPLGIVLYILGTPGRRKARKAQEEDQARQAQAADPHRENPEPSSSGSSEPDAGGQAPTGVAGSGAGPAAGAPVRKEP